MNLNKNDYERVSIYIPKILRQAIDLKRKDVPRSKFVLRILEQHFSLGA
jgi:hypothetical protein